MALRKHTHRIQMALKIAGRPVALARKDSFAGGMERCAKQLHKAADLAFQSSQVCIELITTLNEYPSTVAIDSDGLRTKAEKRRKMAEKEREEDGYDADLAEMYEGDAEDLDEIADMIDSQDYAGAWKKAQDLDTDVREDIPTKVFDTLGDLAELEDSDLIDEVQASFDRATEDSGEFTDLAGQAEEDFGDDEKASVKEILSVVANFADEGDWAFDSEDWYSFEYAEGKLAGIVYKAESKLHSLGEKIQAALSSAADQAESALDALAEIQADAKGDDY